MRRCLGEIPKCREDSGNLARVPRTAWSPAAELHARRESLLSMATSARSIAIETLHWIEAINWESRVQSVPEPESKVEVKH